MNNEVDSVLEGLTTQELKDTVVRNVREIQRLREDAKMYAKAAREAIKSLDDRNADCLELILLKKMDQVGA